MAIAATVTNAGLKLIAAAISSGTSCQVSYVAIGTGSTAPSATDTQLVSESSVSGSRVSATGQAGTNAGEITLTGTLQATEGVGVAIQEVGYFSGGSSAANTGTLIARALYSHTKLNSETLTLSLDLTI